MSETVFLKPTDPGAAALIARTFPGFNLKQVALRVHAEGGMSLSSYWSGGTRDYHKIVRLEDMAVVEVPENGSGFTAVDRACGPSGIPNKLPAPGFAVVSYTDGCYKRMTIHLHADNAAKLIPPPAELTWAEKVVLAATRSLKASYNGRTRFDEAHADTKISRDEYESAKAGLTARKLLNWQGALTIEGKNASAGLDLYRLRTRPEVIA